MWFTMFPDRASALYLAVALLLAGIGLAVHLVATRNKRGNAHAGGGTFPRMHAGAWAFPMIFAATVTFGSHVTIAADQPLDFGILREAPTTSAASAASPGSSKTKGVLDFAQLRNANPDPVAPFAVDPADGSTPEPPKNIYSLQPDVLYVFTMPNCGPCRAIEKDVTDNPDQYPKKIVFLHDPEWHPAWVAERAKSSGYPIFYARNPAGRWSLYKSCPPANFRTLVRGLKT